MVDENSQIIKANHSEASSKVDSNESLLRGALKIEASTSTPNVTAGMEFSIYVVIRNPFPVPVTIYSTETHIPVELSDEIWRQQQKDTRFQNFKRNKADLFANVYTIKGIGNSLKILRMQYEFYAAELIRTLWKERGPRVAVAVSPLNMKSKDDTSDETSKVQQLGDVELTGNHNTLSLVQGTRWELHFSNMTSEEVRSAFWDINEYIRGDQPITLNPGNSVVKHFILKTIRWVTFNPISHTFQIQVRYELDKLKQIDTLPFSLVIRAPIKSSISGAIIGSIFGYFVSSQIEVSSATAQELALGLVRTIIFALMIVIAFARKNEVQQIVSVEDFWGGIFIGFLTGYSGETFIQAVLGDPN